MKELFTSKKFQALLLGAVCEAIAANADQPWWVVVSIAATFVAYIIGQGLADHGKVATADVLNAIEIALDEAKEKFDSEGEPKP